MVLDANPRGLPIHRISERSIADELDFNRYTLVCQFLHRIQNDAMTLFGREPPDDSDSRDLFRRPRTTKRERCKVDSAADHMKAMPVTRVRNPAELRLCEIADANNEAS